jgi:Tol biopolymer transport system component
MRGQFSPDGKWIAYTSDHTGNREVYLRPFSAENPSSGKVDMVSSNGGDQPRWRSDGKELFFRGSGPGPGRGRTGGEAAERGTETPSGGAPVFAVSVVNGVIGAAKRLFPPAPGPVPGYPGNSYYDVTPNGQRFLVSTYNERNLRTPLTVVLNWASSLKR